MRSVLTTWFLLTCLLLQSVAWALPDHRAAQTGRLAHALAHAVDHGHHEHSSDAWGHEVDPTLQWHEAPGHADHSNTDAHGPHHSHAADAGQVQGLPVPLPPSALHLPAGPPGVWALLQPPSADPRAFLRPPRRHA